jgi:hypothetical protein
VILIFILLLLEVTDFGFDEISCWDHHSVIDSFQQRGMEGGSKKYRFRRTATYRMVPGN